MTGYALTPRCDVTIFEARDRVGGRVWSKSKSSGIVEAGAELIGYNHPLWLYLAREFELGLSVNTSDTNFDALHLDMPLYLDGRKILEREQRKLYKLMDKCIEQMIEKADAVDANEPWKSPGAKDLDKMSLATWISKLDCDPTVERLLRQQFENDGGVPCERQSFLANLAVIKGGALPREPDAFFTQSETLRCSTGNQSLADCLAGKIRESGGVIHQLAPVKAIKIEPDRVTVEADGRSYEVFDYVVLAIPPVLWPGGRFARLQITPKLPKGYYVSMGRAVKYLSPLKKRFWIREGSAPTATSSEFGVTWEGTDNQIAAPGRDVGLSLFAGAGPADSALAKWKAGGSRAVDDFYAAELGKVYPGYKTNLSQAPEFVAWPEDPWTGASYSCFAPGEVCRAGPLFAQGFRKRMFFAGEHTCFAYMGYMEGALQSGCKAAEAIITAAANQGSPRKSRRAPPARNRATSRR
jgi:monoamine oxidase